MGVVSENAEACPVCGNQKAIGIDCLWCRLECDVDSMVASEIERRRSWVREWFGDRCDTFEAHCMICRVWADQDRFERLAIGK